MSPYPPSFLLYTILISPEANENHFNFPGYQKIKDKVPLVRDEMQENGGRSISKQNIDRYKLISHQFLRFENHRSHDQHLQVALLLQTQSRVACQSTLCEQPVKTAHNLGRSNVRKERKNPGSC